MKLFHANEKPVEVFQKPVEVFQKPVEVLQKAVEVLQKDVEVFQKRLVNIRRGNYAARLSATGRRCSAAKAKMLIAAFTSLS